MAAAWSRSAAVGTTVTGVADGRTRGQLSQPGLLQSQDRPGAGLSARHKAVDVEELVGAVRLAADRPDRADCRRTNAGGEA